jgi:hypothetical protein
MKKSIEEIIEEVPMIQKEVKYQKSLTEDSVFDSIIKSVDSFNEDQKKEFDCNQVN